MHYQTISNIQVQQIPTDDYPDRKLLLVFSFVSNYEGSSTWAELTQTLKLELPKNVVIRGYRVDGDYGNVPDVKLQYVYLGNVTGQDSNLGGFDSTPVFLRGDLITFNNGYRAVVNGAETTYMTGQDGIPDRFKGYISKVQPKLPFTLECEDNMWLLKQMPTPAKNWGNMSLQQIVSKIMADSQTLPLITRYKGYVKLSVSDFSREDLKFNVNNFTTIRESLAALLARLKSQYRIDSYFRGDVLRVGYLHYIPEDTVKHTFTFQKNILDGDRLKWQRRDDATLSMIVKTNYLVNASGVTIDGLAKTKHGCTEILIYSQAGTYTYVTKKKGEEFPTKYLKDVGEQFVFNVYTGKSAAFDPTDPKQLFDIGVQQLKKYYYDGFKGSFTILGIPYVKHGDTVQLVNPALPEQDGLYKVKAVRAYGGFNTGWRQEITIDYRIDK